MHKPVTVMIKAMIDIQEKGSIHGILKIVSVKIAAVMNNPKNKTNTMTPIGVSNVLILLVPVAELYKNSIHFDFKLMG
jgi:hypothetical protein